METNLENKRIAPPEFWRFIFIMYICILHFEEDVYDNVHLLAYGGYLGVDFFLILSGFAIAYSNDRRPIESPLRFAFSRVKKIYPDFLFAIILMFSLWIIYESNGVKSILLHIYECRFQFFFVNALFPTGLEMRSIWFLSYWLVGTIVVAYIMKRKNLFLCGGVALSYMSWHWCNQGSMFNNPVGPDYLWSVRLTRCVSEMIIGTILYELLKIIGNVKLTCVGKSLLSFFEIIVVAYVLYFIQRDARNHTDYYICLGFTFIIILSFWNRTYLSHLIDNSYSIFLGKLSMPIYLYHLFVIRLAQIYLPNYGNKPLMYISVLVAIIVSSCLFHSFVNKYFKKVLITICGKLVEK